MLARFIKRTKANFKIKYNPRIFKRNMSYDRDVESIKHSLQMNFVRTSTIVGSIACATFCGIDGIIEAEKFNQKNVKHDVKDYEKIIWSNRLWRMAGGTLNGGLKGAWGGFILGVCVIEPMTLPILMMLYYASKKDEKDASNKLESSSKINASPR